MRISVPGTKREIPMTTEGIIDHSLTCSKTNQKRNESALGSCWHLGSAKLDVCAKQTNEQTPNKNQNEQKRKQNKTQFK